MDDGWMMSDERMQGIVYRRKEVTWKDGWMKGCMGKRGTAE